MEIWKMRPGLSYTLIRTINYAYRRTDEELNLLKEKFSSERYKLWISSDECRISATNAIREYYLKYKNKKLNAYKKLNFCKMTDLNDDIIYQICNHLK
jgi:hypothetical protein